MFLALESHDLAGRDIPLDGDISSIGFKYSITPERCHVVMGKSSIARRDNEGDDLGTRHIRSSLAMAIGYYSYVRFDAAAYVELVLYRSKDVAIKQRAASTK